MNRRRLSITALLKLTMIAFVLLILPTIVNRKLNAKAETRAPDAVILELDKQIREPHNFNWFFPGPRREQGAHQAMWEPLFLLNYTNGALDPWLATEIKANGSQAWTLKLRKGVKWSDGVRFNADDVVFTAQMVLDHDDLPASEAVDFRQQVASVQKLDDLTVTFKLKKPNPRFALETFGAPFFSSFLIMPSHIWNQKDPITQRQLDPTTFQFFPPVGTGPYKLESATKDRVTWTRNENWWAADPTLKPADRPKWAPMGLPQPKKLIWLYVDNVGTSQSQLESNALDAVREYTFDEFNASKSRNPKIVGWNATNSMAWTDPCPRQLEINTQSPIWSDARLRKALSHMVDRAALAKNVYHGTARPSETMFADYGAMKRFADAVRNANLGLIPNADLSASDQIIKDAGYSKGPDQIYANGTTRLTATILVNADLPVDVQAANELQKQIHAGGVDAKVKAVPAEEFWGEDIPAGNYELAYSWLSCGSIAEPYASMSRYLVDYYVPIGDRSPGFNNTGRWNDQAAKDYSGIVKQIGMKPVGDPAIPSLVAQAYDYLDKDTPFISLVQSPKIIPFNTTYWTGWPSSADPYGPPIHSWESTFRMILKLQKATP